MRGHDGMFKSEIVLIFVVPLRNMKNKTILILGDGLTLLIVTLIGFATHGESGISFLPRMLAAFYSAPDRVVSAGAVVWII